MGPGCEWGFGASLRGDGRSQAPTQFTLHFKWLVHAGPTQELPFLRTVAQEFLCPALKGFWVSRFLDLLHLSHPFTLLFSTPSMSSWQAPLCSQGK